MMIKFILMLGMGMLLSSTYSSAIELVIGEERIAPGILFIFEGAIKDTVYPESLHLREQNTQVHIEARANWDIENIPIGTVKGGFIPYLHISSKITNDTTGMITFIDLIPHINLIDNFHYARNIHLPGKITDTYSIEFIVHPPEPLELSFHKDWTELYQKSLFTAQRFNYKGVNFETIARANRTN